MTNNTTTLDDVILNDGDIAQQASQSQMHSNITIDVSTIKDNGPRRAQNSRNNRRPDHN